MQIRFLTLTRSTPARSRPGIVHIAFPRMRPGVINSMRWELSIRDDFRMKAARADPCATQFSAVMAPQVCETGTSFGVLMRRFSATAPASRTCSGKGRLFSTSGKG